jgi:hypothetical protein
MASCAMGADRTRSVTASEQILTRYLGEGFQFLTVPQMLEKAGYTDEEMLAARAL